MRRIVTSLVPLTLLAAACGGAGQYGYDREYVPLDEEEQYIESASRVTYEEVRRDPAAFRETPLGWFGVVTDVDTEGGESRVAMTHRTHRARHLCESELDSSCRVTVSDRESGPFTAVLTMRPEDRSGQDRLWIGSLVKVYGSPTGDFDDEGGPVVSADYYRHWPRGKYVTTGAAGSMRR